ncbi:MAG: hypothetical protein CMJ32_02685 [Phycisphaerae bacterium]|nr:hypothetical protein [Phycisphaerae bacterium]
MKTRATGREMMDDPSADREEIAESFQFIRQVNRWFGGTSATLRCIRHIHERMPQNQAIRILDIGTGAADIPIAINEWADRNGMQVSITCIDNHPACLQVAREAIKGMDSIEVVKADAVELIELYEPGSFDIVHAGMMLHHLDDIEVMTVLRIMQKLARRGLIWNDLLRSWLSVFALQIVTTGMPQMVRNDAILSVRKGFTIREAVTMARKVGLENIRTRRHLWGRFTLTSTMDG